MDESEGAPTSRALGLFGRRGSARHRGACDPGPLDGRRWLEWTDAEVEAFGEGRVLVRDGAVPEVDRVAIRAAIDRVDGAGLLRAAGVGPQGLVRPDVRGDRLAWLDLLPEEPALVSLLQAFRDFGEAAREGLRLGLRELTVQVARYDGRGEGYARHRDAFRGPSSRRVTAIVYLHDAWKPEDGGCLTAWGPEGEVDVAPLPGRLVVFAADLVDHEVAAAWAQRTAVTGWWR